MKCRRVWSHFAILFVGALLLACSAAVVTGAAGYAFAHDSTVDDTAELSDEERLHGVYDYESLNADERDYVEGALAGERYVFEMSDPLPGPPLTHWGDHLVVTDEHDDRYHVFTRRLGVDWASRAGIASLVLAAAGIVLIADAVRRHHAPNYRPLGRFRE